MPANALLRRPRPLPQVVDQPAFATARLRRPPHSEQASWPCLRDRPPHALRRLTRVRWQIEESTARVRAMNWGTAKRAFARPSMRRESTFAIALKRVSLASPRADYSKMI